MTDQLKIDENLYSRQLYAIGRDAQEKASISKVLISGMTGLGVEIAKNAILQGFKSVTIHDIENITMYDLSTNYYATEDSIGKNRAEVSFQQLSELNNYVKVNYFTDPLQFNLLLDYNIIVLVNYPINRQLEINRFTHQNNIHFIGTSTYGLVGQIFCDYTENFTVYDQDGEQLRTAMIESIENSTTPVVKCINTSHNLTSGCIVKFTNIQGMYELNNLESEIEYIDKTIFRIKIDTTNFNKYINGGEITEVKSKKVFNFKSLEKSLENPEFIITDFSDFEKPNKLHALCLSNNDPRNIKKYFDGEISQDLQDRFYTTYNGQSTPINSIIGGIVSQEILKACSGKFTPIYQWLYFDSLESLPDNYKEVDRNFKNTRYDAQIKIFGNEFQKKLSMMKYFIVGSGAIGCELLKNFAMIGLGKIIITDMDTIEKSNLNRQFLFRDKDIGKPKSTTAANAIKKMNPDILITPLQDRVGPETEHFFNMQFYNDLDGVANALDNIQARLYVDSRCVLFKKSLLESGTLGTKANVQVIVPYLTESYGSSNDPPEESFPVCTIKTFPNQIQHCIQWSREQFEELFTQKPRTALEYISNPDKIKKLPTSEIISYSESVKFILENIPFSFEDCIRLAYTKFHEYYTQQIYELLQKYPIDSTTSSGSKFWSGAKKCPHDIDFDINNKLHLEYVIAFSKIWANIFNIFNNYTPDTIKKIISGFPKLNVKDSINNIKISTTDEEEKKRLEDEKEKMKLIDTDELINSLPDPTRFKSFIINPQDFEKDDDTNFHIDYITTASNMRALNYNIETSDRHTIKGIAGKIIPALSTTTSVVAGLVTLELYKLANNFNKLEKYKNAFINLALPYFGFSDPISVKKYEVGGNKYSMWDTFIINKDLTLREFLDHFKENYNLDVDTVTYGNFMLYGIMINPIKANKRLKMKIRTIIEEELNIKLSGNSISLQICTDTDNVDDDTELPDVLFML
ncbi:ubiquitin-activating enzyme [Indivirus ILV1]|uniref:Ubiquitin-activating enzyme n=1 Tax=Indivirus ILV1 TaxID=1977633 RepID=A0A1V0SCZ9_9VIRU|nr:ubiquitin-activating enzyme [Indivirus ILV1]